MITTFDDALYAALVSMELIIAGLIVGEWRSGRVRAIFPFLLAYFVAIHILATPGSGEFVVPEVRHVVC
jgi:hypothetical protein